MPTDLTEPIYEAAVTWCGASSTGQRIRLVGVTASNFREREQLALFGEEDPRRRQAAAAFDRSGASTAKADDRATAGACRRCPSRSSGTR